MRRDRDAELSELVGKTCESVRRVGDEEIIFTCDDGMVFRMYHCQSCCESVTIEDINGDLDDLVGSPILKAEESTSHKNPQGVAREFQDSFTWTFYHFATIKGYVVIRWYGGSHGYYSERVDFERVK